MSAILRCAPEPETAEPEPGYQQRIERALRDIRAGKAVVVVDGADREDEGDLIFAAEAATPELLAFTIRHGSGVVCVPMESADLDRLMLPSMCQHNQDPKGTAYTVSVDARHGVSTGISAADRARTIRLLGDPTTPASDLTRPGHVFPLEARPGGVLTRPGHTEAAVDLTRLAGLHPVGAICEIVNDDGTMARRPALEVFCRHHDLTLVSIADLIAYRQWVEVQLVSVEVRLPTEHGQFRAVGYRDAIAGREHLALVAGDLGDGQNVLVRAHSECLTGDVFGSRRCDCGAQLDVALSQVANEGRGVVLYLRGHEGRGIGLLQKLRTYQLQDAGSDTVEANLELGLPVDARDYAIGAQILADLGVRSMWLLSNNPAKRSAFDSYGPEVTATVPLGTPPTADNITYLRTKRDRMGHDLPHLHYTAFAQGVHDDVCKPSSECSAAPQHTLAT